MKCIFLLACFISLSAFGQSDKKPLLDKLKKTDQLMGRSNPDIFRERITVRQFQPEQKEIIMVPNVERTIAYLRQEKLQLAPIPNVGNPEMLQNPTDPGIYIPKQKGVLEKRKHSN